MISFWKRAKWFNRKDHWNKGSGYFSNFSLIARSLDIMLINLWIEEISC